MRIATWIGTVTAAAALFACGGSKSSTRATEQPAPVVKGAAPSDLRADCQEFFARARECTPQYIPALVDTRVRVDWPVGIAETDKQMGRDALVAKAMEEWANDSKDENIAAACEQIVGSISEEDTARLKAAGETCMAEATCEGFTTCAMKLQEERMTAAKNAQK